MPGIVRPGGVAHGTDVQPVPLAALQQMHLTQRWDIGGVEQVPQEQKIGWHILHDVRTISSVSRDAAAPVTPAM